MKKIRWIIIVCFSLLMMVSFTSCKTQDFMHQVNKTYKCSKKVYNRNLKKYGNASMIMPFGHFSVVWYYDNNKIYVTRIRRTKILPVQEYDCELALDIKDYNPECYPEALDADLFRSSFRDIETDSLYDISVCLEVRKLEREGSDCPLLKELRDQIIKYKLME